MNVIILEPTNRIVGTQEIVIREELKIITLGPSLVKPIATKQKPIVKEERRETKLLLHKNL